MMTDMAAQRQVECTIPILPVTKLAVSVDFYTKKLGFKLDWGNVETDKICSVSRDGASIMLVENEQQFRPAWVWIGLEDDSLFAHYRAQGVKVLQEPKNFSWAYEMKFADPDDNILWLGTEPKSDLPLVDA